MCKVKKNVRSLKVKLTLVYITLGLTGLLLTLVFFYLASSTGIYQGAENRITLLSDEISYSIEILAAQDDHFSMQRLIEKSSTLEGVVRVIVVDTQQKILAHTDKNLVGESLNSPLVSRTLIQRSETKQNQEGNIILIRPLHGQAYTSEFLDVTGALWVEMNISESLTQLQQTFGLVSLASLMILLPFYIAQYYTIKKVIIDRLRDMESAIARSMQEEHVTALIVKKSFGSEDEINTLAQTYNYLATSLYDSQKKIKSERDFALHIMESMGEGLTITNAKGHFEYVNPAYARFLGLSPEEVVGKIPEKFTVPDDHKNLFAEWEIRKNGGASSYETHLLSKEGTKTNVLISSVPRFVDGEFSGSIAVITDISQRAHIEQMTNSLQRKLVFEELTAHLAAAFMNMTASEIKEAIQGTLRQLGELFEVDRTYIFEFTNGGEFMNNTHEWCAENISPQIDNLQNLPSEILPWWMNLLKKGETINVPNVADMPPEADTEKEILSNQGIQSVLVTPITSDNGLFGFMGFDSVLRKRTFSQDEIQFLQVLMGIIMNTITRQQAEEKLHQSESRIRAFLNAVPDLIFRIDENGTFLDFSAGDDKLLYVSGESIIGNHVETILPPDIARKSMSAIKQALETNKPQKFEYEIQSTSETLTYDTHVVPSSPREVIMVAHDVTERARLEQMKSDFINRASHELRTPLTTAILMADLLKDENTEEQRLQFLDILKQELNRQHLLLDDLLVAGRIESKRFEVHLSPMDIISIIKEAISSVKPQADARQINIQLVSSESLPLVNTDRQAFLQVLINLLSNAIKFSHPKDTIEVITRSMDNSLMILVQDHGIGIPAQDLPHISGRFFRAQNATQMEIPGTGIGLYIIKEILEVIGGRMEMNSIEHQGTTVSVYIPLQPDENP
jgi:PAS domain S-box-containing protein